MYLVAGLLVAPDASEDRDHGRRGVGVVREAMPFALRDEDDLALLLAHRLALAEVEAGSPQDVERLLAPGVPMDLVHLPGWELGDVEDDPVRAGLLPADQPPDVQSLPAGASRDGRVLGHRPRRSLLHQVDSLRVVTGLCPSR